MESKTIQQQLFPQSLPHPDSVLFGNREESEEKPSSAESEADDSESEESSDASSGASVEPGKGERWTSVISIKIGGARKEFHRHLQSCGASIS